MPDSYGENTINNSNIYVEVVRELERRRRVILMYVNYVNRKNCKKTCVPYWMSQSESRRIDHIATLENDDDARRRLDVATESKKKQNKKQKTNRNT